MTEIEKQYNDLLDSGELKEMFPSFKGEWEKDKKYFTRYYEENERMLNDNLDDDEDEYFDDYESY